VNRTLAALVLIAFAACEQEKPAPKKPQPYVPGLLSNERMDFDTDNLLSLARGASVVSRTAEQSFQHSAAQAIDGEWQSHWISPADAPEQTLTFALAARSRIRQIGVTPGAQAMQQLRVESSLDGMAWTPVTTMKVLPKPIPQRANVPAFEALYLRATPVGASTKFVAIGSLHAIGEEVAPPPARSIEGCWTINGEPARFDVDGAYVTGRIGSELLVEGGFDGRAAKLMWRARAQYGYMMLTVTPDGRGISGVQWHQVVGHEVTGDGWIGSRGTDCSAAVPNVDAIRERLMERTSRWPLFGLAFDANDKLDPVASAAMLDRAAAVIKASPAKKFRLVAREVRFDPKQNRARAQVRLEAAAAALARRGIDTKRLELVNAGDSFGVWALTTVTQKTMAGGVDLEVNR
jgi:hypothetical protein